MPSEFQYPFSNYTVRYEKFTGKMFWINNETGETYNEAPPNWDGPQVKPRDEVNWEELGQVWWGFIGTRLRRLTPAEALGMNIMNTDLAELYEVSINVATIIASFIVREGFNIGERVRAKRQNEADTWYSANIIKINEDGTYVVKYKDGDLWDQCPRSMIEKPSIESTIDEFFAELMELGSIEDGQQTIFL